jgi:hypothetical protein
VEQMLVASEKSDAPICWFSQYVYISRAMWVDKEKLGGCGVVYF